MGLLNRRYLRIPVPVRTELSLYIYTILTPLMVIKMENGQLPIRRHLNGQKTAGRRYKGFISLSGTPAGIRILIVSGIEGFGIDT